MSNLKIIKPVNGQVNWGNAINSNFELLYQKVNTAIIETQSLKDRIEEVDTLKIENDRFIYIELVKEIGEEDKITAYICKTTNWDNPKNGTKDVDYEEFDPTDTKYTTYQGWFVKVNDNSAIEYEGFKWLTGDILIIHKQSATMTANSTSSVIIERWVSVMGGYFTPVETPEYNTTEKKVEREYNKNPSIIYNGRSSIKIEEPVIHWQPTSYANGQLTYTPYIKIGSVSQQYTACSPQKVDILYTTKGNGNYYTLPSSQSSIIISNVFNNTNTEDMENVGFEIYITNNNGDIIYLPYSATKNTSGQLIINLTRNGCTDALNVRVNVFKE